MTEVNPTVVAKGRNDALSICFSDLCYSLQGAKGRKGPVSILRDVNGTFLAGKMTAVVSELLNQDLRGLLLGGGTIESSKIANWRSNDELHPHLHLLHA